MATLATPPLETHRSPDPDTTLARRVLVVVAVLVLAHVPLLLVHAQQLWERPHYQFFPVLLLGALVLAFRGLRDVGPLTPGNAAVGVLLLALGWACLVSGELINSARLAAVAVQLVLLAAAYTLGGGPLVRRILPAWALLWLAVPPPFALDRSLVLALQTWTARWSSMILDLLGVWHVMAGNVVEVAGRRLLVEEACSGVNSLFSVLACTLFFVFLARRRPVHAVLLLVAAVAWVLVANVARVVLVTCALTRWGVNLVDGWRHDAVGFALFAVALGFLWSTDRLLLFFFGEGTAPVPAPAAHPAPAGSLVAGARKTWLSSWAVACVFGLVLLVHLTLYGPWDQEAGVADGRVDGVAAKLSETSLPASVGPWRRKEFGEQQRPANSAYGEFSKVWSYQQGALTAIVSFDYPFPEYHDLRVCYANQGWALGTPVTDRKEVAGLAGPLPRVEVKMNRSGYRSGHLWFVEFDSQGTALEPVRPGLAMTLQLYSTSLQRVWDRLTGKPLTRSGPLGSVYQVQVFVDSPVPLTQAQRDQAAALFVESVNRLRQQWSGAGQAAARAN